MAPNPRRQDAKLEALYDSLPRLECQGLCHDSCGPIDMSVRERARIERTHGPVVCDTGAGAACSMLDEHRRCRVYDIRPMICRLWGIVESLPCPYGCKPERVLTREEGFRLIAEADLIGGEPGGRERRIYDQLKAFLDMPEEEQKRLARWADRIAGTTPATVKGREAALPPTVLHYVKKEDR